MVNLPKKIIDQFPVLRPAIKKNLWCKIIGHKRTMSFSFLTRTIEDGHKEWWVHAPCKRCGQSIGIGLANTTKE